MCCLTFWSSSLHLQTNLECGANDTERLFSLLSASFRSFSEFDLNVMLPSRQLIYSSVKGVNRAESGQPTMFPHRHAGVFRTEWKKESESVLKTVLLSRDWPELHPVIAVIPRNVKCGHPSGFPSFSLPSLFGMAQKNNRLPRTPSKINYSLKRGYHNALKCILSGDELFNYFKRQLVSIKGND